jgi:hypothetical protein
MRVGESRGAGNILLNTGKSIFCLLLRAKHFCIYVHRDIRRTHIIMLISATESCLACKKIMAFESIISLLRLKIFSFKKYEGMCLFLEIMSNFPIKSTPIGDVFTWHPRRVFCEPLVRDTVRKFQPGAAHTRTHAHRSIFI